MRNELNVHSLNLSFLSGHFVAKNIPDVSFNKNIVSLEILIFQEL